MSKCARTARATTWSACQQATKLERDDGKQHHKQTYFQVVLLIASDLTYPLHAPTGRRNAKQ